MTKRYPEHIEAGRLEAERLGATLEIKKGGKHLIGVIHYAGKCRKTSFSVTPSGMSCRIVERYIRRAVEEMRE